jgi:hypothetical protein
MRRGRSTKPGNKNAIAGDAPCSRKCIGKMQPVPDKANGFGREVMFVLSVVVDNNHFREPTIKDQPNVVPRWHTGRSKAPR